MAWIPARMRDTGGFALAMAIFALVLLAAVVAGGHYSASQEYQIGRGMRSHTASFYAGEAGIWEVLNSWDPFVYAALDAGDTLIVGPVTFEGGSSYTARVVRVGSAADSVKRYFYIEAVGRPPTPASGEHRQAMIVRARFPDLCCDFGLRVFDQLDLEGVTKDYRVSGIDLTPAAWMGLGVCDAFTTHDTAAVAAADTSVIAPEAAYLTGAPPYVEDYPPLPVGVIALADYTWADLVALADHSLIGDVYSTGDATLDANGECDRTDPYNWGEPSLSSHPCFDYFPVIHAQTNLTFAEGARAQGIFLVEQVVTIENHADVYGIILVRQKLEMHNQGEFWGTGWVADDVDFEGSKPKWSLSSCAAKRALLRSSLARPRPVSPRAWVDLF